MHGKLRWAGWNFAMNVLSNESKRNFQTGLSIADDYHIPNPYPSFIFYAACGNLVVLSEVVHDHLLREHTIQPI